MCRHIRQSSKWPRAAAEFLCTRPGQTGKGGTVSSRAAGREPAIRPELQTRCPPGKKLLEGKPALGGASPVEMSLPGLHSETAGPRPVSFQALNL